MATISSPSGADRDARRRSVVLATCCLSVFMAGIDVTIVNVALPSIQGALHASVSGLQWTADAYTVVIACLLMLSGSLADRFGRRRAFQIGLVAFSLGSLLCSLAPSLGWLIAFRGLQAVGGSMLNPVAMSIIVNSSPTVLIGRRRSACGDRSPASVSRAARCSVACWSAGSAGVRSSGSPFRSV